MRYRWIGNDRVVPLCSSSRKPCASSELLITRSYSGKACSSSVSSWVRFLKKYVFPITKSNSNNPGFTESIVPTAFMITVSGYYTQREQALRQTWWFSGTGWFTVIGSALNYGFAQIKGGALTSWQYIYVLAGGLTFLFGIWCFFVPNSAVNAWFLTTEERIVAVERLRAGQTGVRNQKIKMGQIREAALDVKVWLVALIMASA
jgi:MFS family permease